MSENNIETTNSTSLLTNDEPQDVTENTEVSYEQGQGMPEGLSEELWNKDTNSFNEQELYKAYQNSNKRVTDLRAKLSRGHQNTPEDATEYKFDELDNNLLPEGAELNEDIIGVMQKAAKEANLSQEQYNLLMSSAIPETLKMQLEAQEAENEELSEEEINEIKAEQIEKLGPKSNEIISAVNSFLGQLDKQGVFNDEEMGLLKDGLGATAEGVNILNKLRAYVGGDVIPTQDKATNAGWGASQEQELHELINQPNRTPATQQKINDLFARRQQLGVTGALQL